MTQTCQWPLSRVKMRNQEKSFSKKRVSISKVLFLQIALCSTFDDYLCYAELFFTDTMKQFDHPHIIKLIGVCMDDEFYIVMELAAYGEVTSVGIKWWCGLGMLSVAKLGKPPNVPNMRGT